MLPAGRRMRRAADFERTLRSGSRAGCSTVVLHGCLSSEPQVGFVVSKVVGNAVVRNRVKRRLRHLIGSRPWPGYSVVVRALPGAVAASNRELARDLDRCFNRVSS
jgi:ribonuclease P protein component